jgi:hypothetical protein
MFRLLLILTLLFPVLSSAQEDTAAITFEKVFKLRCPGRQHIDSMITSLKSIPGIKLNTDCFYKADNLVALYRAEDLRSWKKLKNQASSYAAGWKEKVPGRCGAGGPPPICPIDHWFRAGVIPAMNEFHALQQEVFLRRRNEIWLALQTCIIGRPLKVKTTAGPGGVTEKTYDPGDLKVIQQK